MPRMTPRPTRVQMRGSLYRTTENHELIGQVIAEKRRRRSRLDPSLWPTEQQTPSFWNILRRKK